MNISSILARKKERKRWRGRGSVGRRKGTDMAGVDQGVNGRAGDDQMCSVRLID